MRKIIILTLLLGAFFVGCTPERPKVSHTEPKLFYPETSTPTQAETEIPDSIVQQALENEVRTRTVDIFREVLSFYNRHQYNSIDKRALTFCTASLKKKYNSIINEWKQLSPEEQAEYIEGPSLWWYFIGGNIDTRSGKTLSVSPADVEIICVDSEIAVLRVFQKVSEMETTYCKVVLRMVNGTWLIDDLIPEAIGGGGDNRSFMNDHW